MDSSRSFLSVTCMFIAFVISACSQTEYLNNDNADTNHAMGAVRYDVSDTFHKFAPQCVTVLPTLITQQEIVPALPIMVERMVARHLTGKVETVIGPMKRQSIASSAAVDLTNYAGREQFLTSANCDAFIVPEVLNAENNYLILWADRSIDLRLRLIVLDNDRNGPKENILWIARHANHRGDGALPFDPISAGVGIFKAGSHQVNEEQLVNIVEEAVRRMMATLPDTRNSTVEQMIQGSTINPSLAQYFADKEEK